MKDTLKPGLTATRSITIDKPRTIDFLGEALRVYATPELVRDFEIACREFLLAHCDPGEDSVGTDVSIKHLAPTLLGMKVEVAVTVTLVEGRRVVFEISAKDDVEQICTGTHGRFVVDVNKTFQRLKAKAAKLAGAG